MCQHFYGHKIKLLLATFRNQQVTCNHSLNDVVYGYKKPNDALSMALNQRKPANDLLWHSDRGSQYASESHRALLTANGITQRQLMASHKA
jgi:hypothetical protein